MRRDGIKLDACAVSPLHGFGYETEDDNTDVYTIIDICSLYINNLDQEMTAVLPRVAGDCESHIHEFVVSTDSEGASSRVLEYRAMAAAIESSVLLFYPLPS